MHCNIIELQTDKDRCGQSSLPDWFSYGGCTSYKRIEKKDYKRVSEKTFDMLEFMGFKIDRKEETVTIDKDNILKHFEHSFECFKKQSSAMTLEDFAQEDKIYYLQECIENKRGTYVYCDDMLYTFDGFLRELMPELQKMDREMTFYLGDLYDYKY